MAEAAITGSKQIIVRKANKEDMDDIMTMIQVFAQQELALSQHNIIMGVISSVAKWFV
jgi:hypothetical protein